MKTTRAADRARAIAALLRPFVEVATACEKKTGAGEVAATIESLRHAAADHRAGGDSDLAALLDRAAERTEGILLEAARRHWRRPKRPTFRKNRALIARLKRAG